MMSRNAFPEPQPDSASYGLQKRKRQKDCSQQSREAHQTQGLGVVPQPGPFQPSTRPEGEKRGEDGRSVRSREEGAEKKKGRNQSQGSGEDRRRSGQEQEPSDEKKPR